jgi:hypothetical protein
MKLIERAWALYRRRVMPVGAQDVQVRETRKAFYAGASVLFTVLVNGVSDSDEPTKGDMDLMEGLQAEIDEFGQELDAEVLKLN